MTPTNETPSAFDRLGKILALEKRQGFRNKAVIGGLEKFAKRWGQEARTETPGRVNLIAEIVQKLESYPALNSSDERSNLVLDLIARIEQREKPAGAEGKEVEPPQKPQAQISTEQRLKNQPPQERKQNPAPQPAKQPEPTKRPEQKERGQVPGKQSERKPQAAKTGPVNTPTKNTTRVQNQQTSSASAPPRPVPERRAPSRRARALPEKEINLGIDAPVTTLSSVGPHYAALLEKLGILTVKDLLWHFPHRYVNYSTLKPIGELERGEEATIMGTVWEIQERPLFNGKRAVVAIVADASGTIQVTWFNPYIKNQLKTGRMVALSGKTDLYMGRLVLNNPEWEPLDTELIHTGRLVPFYPLTKDLGQRWLRQRIKQVVDAWAAQVADFLPSSVLASTRLVSLPQALAQIHFPENQLQLEQAQRRLAFDELFLVQIGALRQRHEWRDQSGNRLTVNQTDLEHFTQALSFTMTNAQERALGEILNDLQDVHPMSRLLQGDVGSGKTAVAAAAMWITVANGLQAAIMAPTEILAEQHYRGLTRLFARVAENGVQSPTLALLTGSQKEAEKERIRQSLGNGEINMVVGTHALIQNNVEFARLGLAIVDEQHRFGVEQRGALKQRAQANGATQTPHLLVMSATPIPRSLALTLYGDLDLSIIDELPPGRQTIKTYVLHPTERERAYGFIERQVEEGRQAYIICPLVEESEQSDAKAAIAEYERLQASVFPQFKLGLLHGRMRPDEKDAAMQEFASNQTQILVSTSVVEVGIDVPNSTVILIESANRFGLAQLHQFRGRVGRGEHASYCLLLAERADQTEDERLKAMAETQDGFKLAEIDLKMRGPGDFFGTRQSGLPNLEMAGLGDVRLMELARREAQKLIDNDPMFSKSEHSALATRLGQFWHGQGDVS